MIHVTCIIPSSLNIRARTNIHQCIESLNEAAGNHISLSIVVVTHGNATSFLKKYPSVLCLYTKTNCFSYMNNLGIANTLHDNPDYFLFINDDAWVDNKFFSLLYDKDKSNKFDMLAPLVYSPNGKNIDSFGSEYFTSGHSKNAQNLEVKTKLATAACLLVKAKFVRLMINRYGFFFNPIYNYYFEDVELSIRGLAIGGIILKSKKSIAFHIGSQTARYKSRFVLHHTYRNALWVILITWPTNVIISHIFPIIIIHVWNMLYGCILFGPFFPIPIVWETFIHLKQILLLRRKIITSYRSSFNFQSLFSVYAYRTHKGRVIKI
jgi:GT2 family glycosyltransferase